jgi:hypothetical protein
MSDSKEVPSDVDGASCPSRCYASIRQTTPFESLPDAISQICAAIDKFRDAPCSAETHLHTAIMRIASCLPGWEPDGFQKVEVDAAVQILRVLVPHRFEA